jgi:DNA-binding PadR family transcriptional regulator
MSVSIQDRDQKMFELAFSFRVVAAEQLRKKFFKGGNRSTSYARLSLLERAGYLRTVPVSDERCIRKCVALTEKGWETIKHRYPSVETPYLKSESPVHDVRFAAVGLRMQDLKVCNRLLTENELQSASEFKDGPYRDIVNIQSDGVLELKDPNKAIHRYAVEFEISKKAHDRYVKKLSAYYNTGAVDGVLYICGDQEIRNAIARADEIVRTGPSSIVHVASEDDVLNSNDRITFDRLSGGGIGLY